MRTREPEHVSEPLVNVLRSIERAYCAAHGLTVDDIDAETPDEDAPCRRRSRDPPNEALRVKGEIFGIDEKKGEMTEWLSKWANSFSCGEN